MMDTRFQTIHDRATRGEQLTTDEQAALDSWYAQEDRAESQLLLAQTPSETATQLHTQVAAAAAQLEAVSQHIRAVLAENEQVRHEIILLQRQLAQRTDRAA
jgi:predicted  nucleic acid-binding Zn-ribbon protein